MTDPLTVLLDEADARYGGHISTHYEGCYLDHVGCFAVAVRDVFEQAHAKELDTSTEPAKNGGDSLHVTPTDGEREAATQELCGRCGWAISGHLRSQYGLDCPPGGARPGFRRTAVQEPQSA